MTFQEYITLLSDMNDKLLPLLTEMEDLVLNVPEVEGVSTLFTEGGDGWYSLIAELTAAQIDYGKRCISYSKTMGEKDPFAPNLDSLIIVMRDFIDGLTDGSILSPYLQPSIDQILANIEDPDAASWLPLGVTRALLDEAIADSAPKPPPNDSSPTKNLKPAVRTALENSIAEFLDAFSTLKTSRTSIKTSIDSTKATVDDIGSLTAVCGDAVSLVCAAINKGMSYLDLMDGVMSSVGNYVPNIGQDSGYDYAKVKILAIDAGTITKEEAIMGVLADIPPTMDYQTKMQALHDLLL